MIFLKFIVCNIIRIPIFYPSLNRIKRQFLNGISGDILLLLLCQNNVKKKIYIYIYSKISQLTSYSVIFYSLL